MQENDVYQGLATDKDPGPLRSIEGYIICVTGLNEET